jgi:uncharacterized protein YbaR (Trm112 family)
MSTLTQEFVDLLRCPATGQRLIEAPESLKMPLRSRRPDCERWLLRVDGRAAYPVCEGLPLLLEEEAVAVCETESEFDLN